VNFTVEDTTDFEICAKVSSHIENHAVAVVCQGMVGLMFRNISHVALEGLTFISCGKGEVMYSPVYSDYMTTYGVSIYLGQDIKISNCSIQDSDGTAMGVLYSSLNLRGSNSFTNNCRGCFDRNHTSLYALGGGIYTKTSTLIVSLNDNSAGEGIARQNTHNSATGHFGCALLLVFAFNTQADPSVNLLAISSVAFGLMLMTRYTGAVYRKLYVDILEASFIFNLGVFAVATYYVKLAVVPVSQAVVAYTPVSVVFATFIGLLLYNIYQ